MLSYRKEKNNKLIAQYASPHFFSISKYQTYCPIYNKLFQLTPTNYKHVTLNTKNYITSIQSKQSDKTAVCNLTNDLCQTSSKTVFFKFVPLLDPVKFLVGEISREDMNSLQLPSMNATTNDINTTVSEITTKVWREDNSAYIDCFFVYLSSQLLNMKNFVHGIDCYGTFTGIQSNFKCNIYDDIDYLAKSQYFWQNRDLYSFDGGSFDEIFADYKPTIDIHADTVEDIECEILESSNNDEQQVNQQVECCELEVVDSITTNDNDDSIVLNSHSCKISDHGNNDEPDDIIDEIDDNIDENIDENIDDNVDDNVDENIDNNLGKNNEEENGLNEDNEAEEWEDIDEDDDETLMITIHKFPVQVVSMEQCEDTLDNLILNNDLSDDELLSALMQVIMILITYQKLFSFTHNDLHTNNIMYVSTNRPYFTYKYNNTLYRVPTYGRCFKIIDFGRSIYKFNGNIFCSDSFYPKGDAYTQYNTEPFFNSKKPRIDPNFGFDLCRLGCSLIDFVIDGFDDIKNASKLKDPIKKLIIDWTSDDNGRNIIYKSEGVERFPDFKLYQMIARLAHKNTPDAQLSRPEFSKYRILASLCKKTDSIIDIDAM